ncbi:flavodoxin family protein [Estrella lausannensis]|uniref:NADPH-dependent FMN reductase n=1 Tax=Estrella lausannensis TaxID=483423 RepID=A0A0H5DS52_9BACT|nr:NAD(P)H-dependent oxidoreductase [Estrella lausannensis]CRX39556.1 NADPH-dependent FMN reductase [Estrella lausannensis]
MNSKPLIILGSSRKDGHTAKAIDTITGTSPLPFVDLSSLNMTYFDYDFENRADDFIPLMEKVVEHNPLILATPVYWYTMSAVMKTFLDRWSDLLTFRKDLGKKLKGKDLYLITSFGTSMPKGFEEPFIQTADYMGMHFRGCFYFYSGKDPDLMKENERRVKEFKALLKKNGVLSS